MKFMKYYALTFLIFYSSCSLLSAEEIQKPILSGKQSLAIRDLLIKDLKELTKSINPKPLPGPSIEIKSQVDRNGKTTNIQFPDPKSLGINEDNDIDLSSLPKPSPGFQFFVDGNFDVILSHAPELDPYATEFHEGNAIAFQQLLRLSMIKEYSLCSSSFRAIVNSGV